MEESINPELLKESEWSVVANAIPGFKTLTDEEQLKSVLQLRFVAKATTLPAIGMYIVLEGTTSLQLHGDEIATAGRADYFYEEHLIIDDLTVELTAHTVTDSRLLFLSKEDWDTLAESTRSECLSILFGDLVNVHLHDFQQPINCCNVTAVALSLTALGFTCDVNDIFEKCSLPVSYVVDDGLTLGELYDVASSYIFAEGLRDEVGVELYYFDKAVMSKQDLFDAIAESDRVGGAHDILAANFGVGIAHSNPELSGGHFALIAKCNQSTGLIHMMDVHPAKYGKIWVTSIDRLFESMADYDNSSMRSRGMMRFIVKKEVDVRLDTLAKSDCYPVNCTQYIDLTPENRRHIFSRASTNLNSLCVLSMGLGVLDNHPIHVDELLDAAHLSYTEALSFETTSEQLCVIANDYLSDIHDLDIKCSHHLFSDSNEATKEGWFKRQLLSIANNPKASFMINIDYNEVMGFEAIHESTNRYRETPFLKEFWCVCVDYLYESDVVIVADMSSATSQIWRAPRTNLFHGLREKHAPGLAYLEKTEPVENPSEFDHIVSHHKLVLFHDDEDQWSYTLRTMLGNIGATELYLVDISGFAPYAMDMRRKLSIISGREKTPYLYLNGDCLGDVGDIIAMIRDGSLQAKLQGEGVPILPRSETPSLDDNIFSYPKGGLTQPREGKRNILLCCCGSAAADKIPDLIDKLTIAGHNIKLVPTPSSEIFFKDIGMERILGKIRPSDIYRDDDEWNFSYTDFGMPIRAAHLSLCEWADCVVVTPITCNTMGKVAHGVADNLLSSILIAWQYKDKPAIFCPASDSSMWNNETTQLNVSTLKQLGAQIAGPRSDLLSNGRMVTGMMATPDKIMSLLTDIFMDQGDMAQSVIRWARATASDVELWAEIYKAIDDGDVSINITDENGDSLLHFACGGEGRLTESGIDRGVPATVPMGQLISRGIDVNLQNNYDFSALHVAIMNGSPGAIEVLLDAGVNVTDCMDIIEQKAISEEVRQTITSWIDRES